MGAGPHKPLHVAPAAGEAPFPYATAEDFDKAIKDRVAAAAARSAHGVSELRRQFAYDRLLTRVFLAAPDRWVLKGATGLLARIPGQARHTQDIDMYFDGQPEAAAASLAAAATLDVGDFFTFDVERTRDFRSAATGTQEMRVTAYIGDKVFTGFGVDIALASHMTQLPETTPALAPITIPGLVTAQYRTYPIVDQIADKHAAMVATYGGKPSTRYRDLADIVLIAMTQRVDSGALHTAVFSELRRRGLDPPASVSLPSPDWEDGYAVVVADLSEFPYRTASEALEVANKLLAPVLTGRTTGTWNPETLTWNARSRDLELQPPGL